MFLYLTVDDVIALHAEQLAEHGGSAGLRSRSGLEGAVASPQATFDGVDLYPDLFTKAAVYAVHIAEAQPFVDGNKRAALAAAVVFLDRHGVDLGDDDASNNALANAMLAVAAREMDKEGLAGIFESLARPAP